MNSKQARRARAVANTEAKRLGLWKQGEASMFSKWWRRIFAKLFPRLRKRYTDIIGRWYKHSLKEFMAQAAAKVRSGNWRWSDELGQYVLAGDDLHNERIRARLRRKWEARRARERKGLRAEGVKA